MSRALGLQLVNIKLNTYLSTCTPIAERPVVIRGFFSRGRLLNGAEYKVTLKSDLRKSAKRTLANSHAAVLRRTGEKGRSIGTRLAARI